MRVISEIINEPFMETTKTIKKGINGNISLFLRSKNSLKLSIHELEH